MKISKSIFIIHVHLIISLSLSKPVFELHELKNGNKNKLSCSCPLSSLSLSMSSKMAATIWYSASSLPSVSSPPFKSEFPTSNLIIQAQLNQIKSNQIFSPLSLTIIFFTPNLYSEQFKSKRKIPTKFFFRRPVLPPKTTRPSGPPPLSAPLHDWKSQQQSSSLLSTIKDDNGPDLIRFKSKSNFFLLRSGSSLDSLGP